MLLCVECILAEILAPSGGAHHPELARLHELHPFHKGTYSLSGRIVQEIFSLPHF